MKKIMSLVLVALMTVAVFAISVSAAETNLIDPTKWVCQNDAGDVINGLSGITAGADGKIELTALQNQWLHLVQEVTVEPGATYDFTLVCNLTEGGLRLDHSGSVEGGYVNDGGMTEVNLRYADKEAAYGTKVTFTAAIVVADDQSTLKIDIRNSHGADADPWYVKGVGVIESVTLVKRTADAGTDVGANTDTGTDAGNDNADTADFVPAVIVLATVAVIGTAVVSKKRR